MTTRIVVTGLGVISSAGTDAASFLESVATGRSCLSPVNDPRYHPSIRVMAGLVAVLPEPVPCLPVMWPKLDRFVYLALLAAEQALRQAGVSPAGMGRRMGAVLGTCTGPTTLIEEYYQSVLDGVPDRSSAQAFRVTYGSAVRAVARVFGIGGFTGTVTTACSAGLTAIGTGADLIRSGLCDVVLAGGSDAYNISTQIGFDGLKAPSDGPSAPFSKPTGLCLGEGAAFLILESLERARERSAPILGEILGFGTSNDAHHCSSPDPSGQGQSLAVLRAMEDAGIAREHVGYINAHGTGTLANDKAETKAIRRVFGPEAARIPVSSQKAVFGHTLGAAGALETAATLLCHGAGRLPPTANFTQSREGCDLDYIPQAGRIWPQGQPWIKESFAFGGHNAALVLGSGEAAIGLPAGRPSPARVCITGIGVVTSGGAGMAAFRRMLSGGGLVEKECAPPGHGAIRAALVPDELDSALDRRFGLRRMDKAGALGTVAAYLALTDAGLSPRPDMAANIGLFLGHSSASNAAEASFVPDLLRHDYVIQSVADFPFVVPNATAGTICRALGLRGHNAAFCFGGGAGLMSLVAGVSAIANRHAPFLLAGSVDVLTQRGWGDPLPGDGRIPTEGAAIFLLESEDHLRERTGRALATIAGMAVATDAEAEWDAAPSNDLVRSTAEAALAQAGLGRSDLGIVCGPAAVQLGRTATDISTHLGRSESCEPLFDIAAGLLRLDTSTIPILSGRSSPALCETRRASPCVTPQICHDVSDPLQSGPLRPLLSSLSSRQGLTVSVVVVPSH